MSIIILRPLGLNDRENILKLHASAWVSTSGARARLLGRGARCS